MLRSSNSKDKMPLRASKCLKCPFVLITTETVKICQVYTFKIPHILYDYPHIMTSGIIGFSLTMGMEWTDGETV